MQETAAINGKEFKAVFNLPFREALKLAEEIVREIGIGPNSAYKLIVQSTLNPFFGYNINVITARIIFSVLFLFFLVLLLYQRQKNKEVIVKNPAAAEVRRIRKKYGNRIIEIADLKEIPAGYLQVQLHNFKDLLKLAEEREHPILHFNSVESQSSCFYTVDDNTVYVCRLNLS